MSDTHSPSTPPARSEEASRDLALEHEAETGHSTTEIWPAWLVACDDCDWLQPFG